MHNSTTPGIAPRRHHPETIPELCNHSGLPEGWVWQGYLAPGSITLLTSQWKAGKTTLLSVLLARMGDGGTLAGLPVRKGRVYTP